MENNVPPKEIIFPSGLHRRIMRRLFFEKYRLFLLSALWLSFFSSLISGWYVWRTLIEKGTMDLVLDFYSELNLSGDFISQAGSFIADDISWVLLSALFGSIALFLALFFRYFGTVLQSYKY